jgi:hypothetical protein
MGIERRRADADGMGITGITRRYMTDRHFPAVAGSAAVPVFAMLLFLLLLVTVLFVAFAVTTLIGNQQDRAG